MTDERHRARTARSVRARISVGVAAAATIGVVVIAIVAPGLVRRTLEDDLLRSEAADVAAGLEFIYDDDFLNALGPDPAVDPASIDEVFADSAVAGTAEVSPGDEYLAAQLVLLRASDRLTDLVDATGGRFVLALDEELAVLVAPDGSIVELLDGIEPSDGIETPVLASDELDQYLYDDLGLVPIGDGALVEAGGAGRILIDTADVDGIAFLVTAGADAIDESVAGTRLLLWIVLPLAVTGLTALAWALTTRALRPVAAITERAATINAGGLDARVPVPDTGDEIAELASTVNGMIDRIDADDRRRRQFISDASHELRTPVAVIRNEAEVALRHPADVDAGELASAVADEAQRLSRIVDDLLALARHDEGRTVAATEIDLDDIVLAECGRTRRVPVSTAEVGAARLTAVADDLAQMVAHLLDNAARHATSQVAVGLRTDGDEVVLTVDDDGPGVPTEHRDAIFERFARLDDARTRDRGGAGLGLSVVAETAHRAGGRVEVADAELGGARFTVRMPIGGQTMRPA